MNTACDPASFKAFELIRPQQEPHVMPCQGHITGDGGTDILPMTAILRDMIYSAAEAVGCCRRSALIISDAFSAIIKVGELVLPLVMLGMTEASTTRRPRNP